MGRMSLSPGCDAGCSVLIAHVRYKAVVIGSRIATLLRAHTDVVPFAINADLYSPLGALRGHSSFYGYQGSPN